MMSITIKVNGSTVYHRSAINVSPIGVNDTDDNYYKVDTGKTIKHKPKDGIVALAKKLLATIKET